MDLVSACNLLAIPTNCYSIMEGIVTVALGVAVPWILPDSPQLCTFLTPAEKAFIDRRLARDSGTEHGKLQTQEGYQFSSVKNALLDWKIWFCCLIYNGGRYAFLTYPSKSMTNQNS